MPFATVLLIALAVGASPGQEPKEGATPTGAIDDLRVPTAHEASKRPDERVFGRSVRGRPLVARRSGEPRAERDVLVVGSIHGDERQGERIVAELRRRAGGRLGGTSLWLVETANPDGAEAGTRGNSRGVDLNRNFAYDWRPIPPTSGYYSGPRAASEPETRALQGLIRRVRPDLTVHYHQPWGQTLIPCGSRGRAQARRYSQLTGLPPRDCYPSPPGSVTGWQRGRLEQGAFVAELPGRALRSGEVRRHARAVVRLARR